MADEYDQFYPGDSPSDAPRIDPRWILGPDATITETYTHAHELDAQPTNPQGLHGLKWDMNLGIGIDMIYAISFKSKEEREKAHALLVEHGLIEEVSNEKR